jgi:hypothetical protein
MVEPDRPQMTMSMRTTCWKLRLETHTQTVIRIAFARQQWLRERASMLCYTYIACLVETCRRLAFWRSTRLFPENLSIKADTKTPN